MALRYRNEHVINSLRTAYSLKHRDDSLLSDENVETITPSSLIEIEEYIAGLTLKIKQNGAKKSAVETTKPSQSLDTALRSDSFSMSSFERLSQTGTRKVASSDDESEEPETDPNSTNVNRVEQITRNFTNIKGFDLDIEDESDYEDNLLRATREIKQSTQSKGSRAISESNSSTSCPSDLQDTFNSQEIFAKRNFSDEDSHVAASRPTTESQLTSQLVDNHRDPRDQYLEALTGLKTSGIVGLKLSMHIAGHGEPVQISINPICSAHLAIGYSLYVAKVEPGDANMYNLRLVEDDGEPDEDFPALDRTRAVASYHVDEFALVRATEKEFRENSKRTPNKVSFKSKCHYTGPKVNIDSPSMVNNLSNVSSMSPNLQECQIERPKLVQLNSFSDMKTDFVCVQVYMHPYDPIFSHVFWSDDMVQKNTVINDLFEQMCKEKMMDSDMYVLRTVDQPHQIVNTNDVMVNMVSSPTLKNTVSSSSSEGVSLNMEQFENYTVKFELIARRNLQGTQGQRLKSSSTVRAGSSAADEITGGKSNKKTTNDLQNAVMAMQPLGFYKYAVLRRQQMNFLGRSERELVIDGEYIHIMPPADWSILDQPKTTTFHIRQVLRIKQSRKTATNFSIIIMKSSGPKRYDLESKDASTTEKIVEQLQHLKDSRYKAVV